MNTSIVSSVNSVANCIGSVRSILWLVLAISKVFFFKKKIKIKKKINK